MLRDWGRSSAALAAESAIFFQWRDVLSRWPVFIRLRWNMNPFDICQDGVVFKMQHVSFADVYPARLLSLWESARCLRLVLLMMDLVAGYFGVQLQLSLYF